ncbi:MAG: hypothetical protein K0U98_27640 [Deltaproteobacteria bacterium]|nr:hypothetical protein [Deltaproteobacteria bacterium]
MEAEKNQENGSKGKRLPFPVPAVSRNPTEVFDYTEVLERARILVREKAADLARERLEAPALLEGLLATEAKGRRLWIDNSPRFRSLVLGNRLLSYCEKEWLNSAASAEDLASLAGYMAQRLDSAAYSQGMIFDLRALAAAYEGNCQRLQGHLDQAADSMARALELVGHGTGDLELEPRILGLRAVLYGAQQRFPEALALLERVEAQYRTSGDRRRLARTLISRGKLLIDSGAPARAEWALHRAQQLIQPLEEPRLLEVLEHNLICCSLAKGELLRAKQMLARAGDRREFSDATLEENRLRLEELLQQSLDSKVGAGPADREVPVGASPFLALAAEDDGRILFCHLPFGPRQLADGDSSDTADQAG